MASWEVLREERCLLVVICVICMFVLFMLLLFGWEECAYLLLCYDHEFASFVVYCVLLLLVSTMIIIIISSSSSNNNDIVLLRLSRAAKADARKDTSFIWGSDYNFTNYNFRKALLFKNVYLARGVKFNVVC